MSKHLWFSKIVGNNYFILFVLWFVLTAVNINKAFHIDDTFHLDAAAYLMDHPSKPMSGLIIWGDNPTPMYTHNQPPLFFYMIAVVSNIFGFNEIPLHLFLSIFTFLALYYFQKIVQLLDLQNINVLLLLFAFNPAFIINQNLMIDVPILAITLGVAYFLLKTNRSNKLVNYILASFYLGFGLLFKYSILPFLVVLIIVVIAKQDYKKLFVTLIPISFLVIWSLINYAEFGSIHLLNRPRGIIHINQFWAFMACLGSLSTYSLSFALGINRSKTLKLIFLFISIIFFFSIILVFMEIIPESQFSNYLNLAFIINGFIIFISIFMLFIEHIKVGFFKFMKTDDFIIFLFLASLSAFFILFAPFIASRHILMVIPFILLFGQKLINKVSKRINNISIIFTIILGLLLGVSDWVYADYYRQMASSVDLSNKSNVWANGLWGWKWYATKKGMMPYSTNNSNVKEGDYIIYPGDIPLQKINQNIDLVVIDKIWKESNLFTFFSGNDFASMYNSWVDRPPWKLSKNPIDTIYICKIRVLKKDTTYKSNRAVGK